MSIIDKLSSAPEEKSNGANKILARQIAAANDTTAIKELVANLHNKAIQGDCIKVLYETGEINPQLIVGYAKQFVALLDSKNNRMQWGGMTALNLVTLENATLVHNALGKIADVAEKGSVITKDHFAHMLLKLCSIDQYRTDALALFMELLQSCPPNQLPTYAEDIASYINSDIKTKFIKILNDRIHDVEKDTKKKRMEMVIKKVTAN